MCQPPNPMILNSPETGTGQLREVRAALHLEAGPIPLEADCIVKGLGPI
jgi:hypothetical protein